MGTESCQAASAQAGDVAGANMVGRCLAARRTGGPGLHRPFAAAALQTFSAAG